MRYFLFVFLGLTYGLAVAQSSSGDCEGAIRLESDSYHADEIKGFGNILEFSGNELGNDQYFTEEHNTIWFSFKAPYHGDMTFSIDGKDANEDWDFILFQADKSQCDEIKSKSIKPVRTNLARNQGNVNSITGLDVVSHDEFVEAGVNHNMSKWIEVEVDQEFLLVVDNSLGQNDGFDLSIHVSEIVKDIHIEEEHMVDDDNGFAFVDMTDDGLSDDVIKMNFEIRVEGSNESIDCHSEIVGQQWVAENMVFEDANSFTVDIPKDKWFFVNVKKEGFTFSAEKFQATQELENQTMVLHISKIKAGNHIVLREIVFRENTTHMLPTSVNALEQLIGFMNEYPSARIEIQGHVNAPGYENEGKVKKFSLKRAEQIKEYLVDAGVDGKRIEVAGMGNEFMIYPNPQNYEQEKANRRVEIEILSY